MGSIDGFLIINKSRGWTSFDVVAKIRGLSGQKKVGHAGTLDPLAQGVLAIALGQARFLIDYLHSWDKTYIANVRLGRSSSTDDEEGVKSALYRGPKPTLYQVKKAVDQFAGHIKQIPPDYAALKIDGKKMYDLARRGQPVKKSARPVHIRQINLIKYEYPRLDLKLTVGRGVYIRALARDLGRQLGTKGYLANLVRTQVGPFSLDQAIDVSNLDNKKITKNLVPLEKGISHLPQITLPRAELEKLAHGQTIRLNSRLIHPLVPTALAIVNHQGRLLIIAQTKAPGQNIKSKKIFDINLRR